MKKKISGYFNSFTDYYEKSLIKRIFVGLIVGGFLWFCIFGITLIFDLFINDAIWWETFLKDLPFLGFILAILVSMQIWGLLPQPMNDNQVSIENVGNIEKEGSIREKSKSE